MKEFLENYGFLTLIIIGIFVYNVFLHPQQEIDEYEIELEQKIEALEEENEMLKEKYCQLKEDDLFCVVYKKKKEETETMDNGLRF